MKLLKIIATGVIITGISFFYSSCKKEIPHYSNAQDDFSNVALVQVFNATVNATSNYIYVDNVQISGAAVDFGGVFPATAYSFKVDPGDHSFLIKDTTAGTSQNPLTFSETLDAAKSYTIFTYDTLTSVKEKTVENVIEVPADTTCRLRFANFIYSASAKPNVDVYSFKRGGSAPVFKNVATNDVTEFIPYAAGQNDTLYVYATGTTSPLLAKALVQSLTETRSYTAAYIGSYNSSSTIATFATY